MIQTLKCPSCAAPLEYEQDSESRTIRCPFCNNTMFVPDELREGVRPRAFSSTYDSAPRTPAKTSTLGTLFIVGIVVGACVLLFLIPYFLRSSPVRPSIERPISLIPSKPTPQPSPAGSGFATVALKFGSEGTGPGRFTDARSIAVDEAGHIYVGEYTGGRIQVFDMAGKFITQWMVDPKMPLRGMAASREGVIYIVQSGKIARYEGTSGKPLGEIAYPGGWGFDDVATTPDGGLVTAWYRGHDDIVRFDSAGRVLKNIRSAISGQSGDSELDTRVATDGPGNIYALGTFNSAVFKFAPDGRFINKFGSSGDQTSQFRAPDAIAVDNQGRVYVSDIKGIQVFDADGRYLDMFKPGGIASGMDFNDKNELFIAARTQVIQLVINKP